MSKTESPNQPAPEYHFYRQLARYWPLISPVAEYAGEAAEFIRVLRGALSIAHPLPAAHAVPAAHTLLELGSGGGHNAFYMKQAFALTLVDVSADMLAVSARLNPECEHIVGDMRSLRLARTFDIVFVHDAIDYMTTGAELAAAMRCAWAHTRPGGIALFVPDALRETFVADCDCAGHDAADGSGVRYLEWSHPPADAHGPASVDYVFILREADGSTRVLHETHRVGLHARARWVELLQEQGFVVEVLTERTDEERAPRTLFLGRRPS